MKKMKKLQINIILTKKNIQKMKNQKNLKKMNKRILKNYRKKLNKKEFRK